MRLVVRILVVATLGVAGLARASDDACKECEAVEVLCIPGEFETFADAAAVIHTMDAPTTILVAPGSYSEAVELDNDFDHPISVRSCTGKRDVVVTSLRGPHLDPVTGKAPLLFLEGLDVQSLILIEGYVANCRLGQSDLGGSSRGILEVRDSFLGGFVDAIMGLDERTIIERCEVTAGLRIDAYFDGDSPTRAQTGGGRTPVLRDCTVTGNVTILADGEQSVDILDCTFSGGNVSVRTDYDHFGDVRVAGSSFSNCAVWLHGDRVHFSNGSYTEGSSLVIRGRQVTHYAGHEPSDVTIEALAGTNPASHSALVGATCVGGTFTVRSRGYLEVGLTGEDTDVTATSENGDMCVWGVQMQGGSLRLSAGDDRSTEFTNSSFDGTPVEYLGEGGDDKVRACVFVNSPFVLDGGARVSLVENTFAYAPDASAELNISSTATIVVERNVFAHAQIGLRVVGGAGADASIGCNVDWQVPTPYAGTPPEWFGPGNVTADPQFCGEDPSPFGVAQTSPCLPGNHPDGVSCGRIGARGKACSPVPTLPDDDTGPVQVSTLRVGSPIPNPFGERTTVAFAISEEAAGEPLSIAIFDVSGRHVRTLRSGVPVEPGIHSVAWDGRDDHGRRVAGGAYFVRVSIGTLQVVRRALVSP